MKFIFRIIKKIVLSVLFIIIGGAIGIAVFMNSSPQFGANPEGESLERVSNSEHFQDGQFVNLVETTMDMSFSGMMETMNGFMTAEGLDPTKPLPVKFDDEAAGNSDTTAYLTWYGHSAFLLEIEGKRILIDPMLGEASSPVSFLSKRFPYENPIDMSDLTDLDAVIISHDHYDHLDYPTIDKIKDEVGHFYVPLGVGSHLQSWGISADNITELDWWENAKLEHIELTATPARHFSGRGITRNQTLWNSWAIKGSHNSIYFSGDGGYAEHFSEIGEKLGPFDIALVECGQYNKNWAQIHMAPEESVQASIDVKSAAMMPIHWGAFTLALHKWTEPALRAKAEAETLGVDFVSPYIGQRFQVGDSISSSNWWEEVE